MKYRELQRMMRESARIPVPFQQNLLDEAATRLIPSPHRRKRFGWLQAALSTLSLGFVGAMSFLVVMATSIKAIVTVDINPGISLSINGFNRIKSADGITDDADTFLAGLSITGMTISDGVGEIYQHAFDLGIIEANDAWILIGVSAENAETELQMAAKMTDQTLDLPWNTLFFNRHVVIDERLYAGTVYEDSRYVGNDISPEFASDAAAIYAEDAISSNELTYVGILADAMTETLLKDLAAIYDVSETKMAIIVYVAIKSGIYQSEAEFAELASRPVSELIALYDSLQ